VNDAKPGANQKNEAGGAANQSAEKTKPDSKNPAFSEAESPDVGDSGSGGIGIALPIILGLLLLGAIAFAVVRHRRRAQTGTA
jgi:hypothetical protein